MDLSELRRSYQREILSESTVPQDPFEQFRSWFKEALASELPEPNAMMLATVSAAGQPSLRAVLLKEFDARGFVFFTNYDSRKAREIAANSHVALLWYWAELERQVRVEGTVTKVTRAESEAYYSKRPRESQLGALTSSQSSVTTREQLDQRYAQLAEQYQGRAIPCPEQWGGFRVQPHSFEFWQGRESRLHDRLAYTRSEATSAWTITRLAP